MSRQIKRGSTVRRKDKEITNRAEIEGILKKAFICHLGLSDGDLPYVVPMNYGYEDGHIYLHCATEGKKLDIIKKNNKGLLCNRAPRRRGSQEERRPALQLGDGIPERHRIRHRGIDRRPGRKNPSAGRYREESR